MPVPSDSSEAWERLSSLYETARSLPPAERARFVADACSDDLLLHKELVGLLAAGEDAERFLNGLAEQVVVPALERAIQESQHPPVDGEGNALHPDQLTPPIQSVRTGARVRNYQIGEELGSGGMGVVYRARDLRLERDVAIKVLGANAFRSDGARRRLLQEARAVSMLDNPHICPLHAVEETADGTLCLVMYHCAHGTLHDRLKTAPLAPDATVAIARQLAEGLQAAHARGIIHRDVKPANIGFAEHDQVKLLDFGVAVVHDGDSSSTVAGTIAYMAPELLLHGRSTTSSDVWSFGVVLFEMLTGRRPFTGDSRATLRESVLRGDVPAVVRTDGVPIPQPLATLVGEMLQRDAALRPADGGEVLRRLDDLERAPSPATGAATSSAPRRVALWAAAAAAIVIAVMAVYRSDETNAGAVVPQPVELLRTTELPPPVAVMPFVVRGVPELDYLREGMVDLLTPAFDATGVLRGIDPQAVLSAARASNTTVPDSTRELAVARVLGAQRYLSGSIVGTGAGITIRATLRDLTGAESGRATVSLNSTNELISGVQALVRQLVAAELKAPGDTIGSLAATSTSSIQALRAFLDGERELRDARPIAAMALFEQAVAADSLFAFAWYRLARAARWSADDARTARATRRAYELSDSLPYRWQTLVRGHYAMHFGSVMDATQTFRDVAKMYPSDVEANMLLGEALFHDNPYHGRSSSEADSVFRHVMTLDPQNREVNVYLMDLAARASALGKLDTLFTMYFTPNSAGEQLAIRATYVALHARRLQQPIGASMRASLAEPTTARIALSRINSNTDDLEVARVFARSMTVRAAAPATRLQGWLALASLRVAANDWPAADSAWQAATMIDARVSLVHQASVLLAPLQTSDSVSSATTREALKPRRQLLLRALRAAAPESAQGLAPGFSRGEVQSVQLYLQGMLAARLADTAVLNGAVQSLGVSQRDDRLRATLQRALAARQALARGDTIRALAAFAESELDLPIAERHALHPLLQLADRFDRAELLRARGDTEAARAWYESVIDGAGVESAPWRAAVMKRLTARSGGP